MRQEYRVCLTSSGSAGSSSPFPARHIHVPDRKAASPCRGPSLPKRDKQAIGYHYDVSNDFYRLWLDERMVYSCAYFTAPGDDLDAAQLRKLDYLCRKLRLKQGERLLDIGCGWGGLIMHAARKYGVSGTRHHP